MEHTDGAHALALHKRPEFEHNISEEKKVNLSGYPRLTKSGLRWNSLASIVCTPKTLEVETERSVQYGALLVSMVISRLAGAV